MAAAQPAPAAPAAEQAVRRPSDGADQHGTVRGILKRTASCVQLGGPLRSRMRWDEENLQENAAYMAANPKMKIDEPPTPYNRYAMEEDRDLQEAEAVLRREGSQEMEGGPTAAQLEARMCMVGAALQAAAGASPQPEQAEDGEGDVAAAAAAPRVAGEGERNPTEEFKNKRRAVYAAEGASFKALLSKGGADDDEDDDDDEEAAPAQ
eukprot:TRINITY_DN4981_c0_g1_i2.p1 TRINITY_DN4981_c0_g1~~TRINITY_DN4981_c0_g1_i2.p1  ORF type:complete len:231 (+),score=79.72 TRINITY_DN4981_c0_g1_i2:70-693(+)